MFLFREKTKMIDPERALPGREERIADILLAFDHGPASWGAAPQVSSAAPLPEIARPILRMLAASRREEAASALGRTSTGRPRRLKAA